MDMTGGGRCARRRRGLSDSFPAAAGRKEHSLRPDCWGSVPGPLPSGHRATYPSPCSVISSLRSRDGHDGGSASPVERLWR